MKTLLRHLSLALALTLPAAMPAAAVQAPAAQTVVEVSAPQEQAARPRPEPGGPASIPLRVVAWLAPAQRPAAYPPQLPTPPPRR